MLLLHQPNALVGLTIHPNNQQIISLEDVRMDASAKALYIVMELMECDLERVLASRQSLTHRHVKVLLKQLLLGVQAMHLRGIIRESFLLRRRWRSMR